VQITAGTTSINALIAGDVDMAMTTSSAVVAAVLRDAPLSIIALPRRLINGGVPPLARRAAGQVAAAQLAPRGLSAAQAAAQLGLIQQDVPSRPGLSESNKRILLIFQGRIDATLATLRMSSKSNLPARK
jgi:hypothetical protein